MTVRARPPTDEIETEVDDQKHTRVRNPTKRGHESGTPTTTLPRGTIPQPADSLAAGSIEEERTDVDPAKQQVKLSERAQARVKSLARSKQPTKPRPVQRAGTEPSAPIQVISMKDSLTASAEKRVAREHKVRFRPLAEVRGAETQPNLGNLAPPRDPRAVRARRLHDLVVWGSVVVIVGCAVMLGVWFLAGN